MYEKRHRARQLESCPCSSTSVLARSRTGCQLIGLLNFGINFRSHFSSKGHNPVFDQLETGEIVYSATNSFNDRLRKTHNSPFIAALVLPTAVNAHVYEPTVRCEETFYKMREKQ